MSINLLENALELENSELQQKIQQKDQLIARQQNIIVKLKAELANAEKSVPEGFMAGFRETEEHLEETENELALSKKACMKLTSEIQEVKVSHSETQNSLKKAQKLTASLLERDHAFSTNLILLGKAVMGALTEIAPSFMLKSISEGRIGEHEIPPIVQTLLRVPDVPVELKDMIDTDTLIETDEGFNDLSVAINSLKMSAHARIETDKVVRSQINAEAQKVRFELDEANEQIQNLNQTIKEQEQRANENDEMVRRKLEQLMNLQKTQLEAERKKLSDSQAKLAQALEMLEAERAKTAQLETSLDSMERLIREREIEQTKSMVSSAIRTGAMAEAYRHDEQLRSMGVNTGIYMNNDFYGNANSPNNNPLDIDLKKTDNEVLADISNLSLLNDDTIDKNLASVMVNTKENISEDALAAKLYNDRIKKSSGNVSEKNLVESAYPSYKANSKINMDSSKINQISTSSIDNIKKNDQTPFLDSKESSIGIEGRNKITNDLIKKMTYSSSNKKFDDTSSLKPAIDLI